jgi:cell division protein FtsQ
MIALRERRLVLGAIGVVLLAAIAVWLVAFSSVFGVGTVRVDGLRTLTAKQVRQAAHIADGTPLLRLDRAAVEHRVERLPSVAAATVRTSFPSTVIISVRERVAVGYLKAGAGYRLVDGSGEAYQEVSATPAHLPQFVVPGGANAKPTAAAVATVAAALPSSLRAQVLSIQALDPDSITLLLPDQRVVRWGSAQRSADKARILPTLLRTHAAQIDVTDPDLPYTR